MTLLNDIFGMQILAGNMRLHSKQCDMCKKLVALDRFFTKTTCRACYTRARR